MDLFADQQRKALCAVEPLAARMRPRTLDEFVGQEAFLGKGRRLRLLIDADCLRSAVFWGPPGSGKTTLARLIALHTDAEFESLHAAEAGVKQVRELLEAAHARVTREGRQTILFLDEIHRFTRAQQDVLLKDVEQGVLILIGATTQNPSFSVNGPLLSRSMIFEFEALSPSEIVKLLRCALQDAERGLAPQAPQVDSNALESIARFAAGDARRALNVLEACVMSSANGETPAIVTRERVIEFCQGPRAAYDAAGDQHYDIASALIKSMRGSDPDAALYWLARMIEGGEDARFIARRILICASEDVGNADPQALPIATSVAHAVEFLGMPEARYALAQGVVYLACAPKSDGVTRAITAALHDVREKPPLTVPHHLRDASYAGAAALGRGQGYRSPHEDPQGFVAQDYLPEHRCYYNPPQRGHEQQMLVQLRKLRERPDEVAGNHQTSNT